MSGRLLAIVSALLLCLTPSCVTHSSRRIVCLGDSLTACGGEGGRYSDLLQLDLPAYEVINSGVGGDTLPGGLSRLEKDVLQWRPGVVIVELGANDYWQRKRTLQELQQDYEEIVSRCRRAGAKVLIVSCFGNDARADGSRPEWTQAGLPLEDYAAGLAIIERELTEKYQCGYVPDMQCGITPKGNPEQWSDSNHPNAVGNRIVADTILVELRRLLE
ncbi:MAG: hypothetical protein J5654_08460 [Victivallales bacterium]|nr:hypothetical protein [Victivallales bacterium]